jgi:hypothetical protein
VLPYHIIATRALPGAVSIRLFVALGTNSVSGGRPWQANTGVAVVIISALGAKVLVGGATGAGSEDHGHHHANHHQETGNNKQEFIFLLLWLLFLVRSRPGDGVREGG